MLSATNPSIYLYKERNCPGCNNASGCVGTSITGLMEVHTCPVLNSKLDLKVGRIRRKPHGCT